MSTVFLSYAREDASIAHMLDVSLTARGIRVLIDRSAIAPAEIFEQRLDAMILEADAVMFLMSPDALASHYCQWEVSRADELKKRIVPVVWRDFNDVGYRPPEGLRKRNWIFLDAFYRLGPNASADRPEFTAPFELIVTAVTTDIVWQRAHTQHIAYAQRWDAAQRPADDFLLSGAEINAAQAWANRKPPNESIPALFFAHLEASLAKAARDLEALNERERRISARTQQIVAREAETALRDSLHARAMRFCLAGEPTADERARGVMPDPKRRAVMAAAAQASPCLLTLPHPRGVLSAQVLADGRRVVTTCADNIVRIIDTATSATSTQVVHTDRVMAIAVAEPVGLFATASRDRIAYVARLDGAGPHMTLQHADEVTSLAFSPDHSFLVSGGFDGWAIVWDVATGRKLHRLKHAEDIHAVVFSPGVHLLITAESGRQARVWRVADWTALHLLPHDGRVYRASFNPDGSRIATASEDSTAAIWDAVTGARLFTLKHQYPVSQAVFSPDGSMLATASMDRGARLWSVATGEHLHHFAHGAEVTDVAFSPDGKRLATASDDHHASIFDTATGDTVARLRHDDTVTRVAFSRDCTQLLTSSLDGTARIWRADARQPASSAPYVRTAAEVTEHLYSPDGTLDIVGWPEDDGTVRIQRAADHVELYQISHDRQRINSVIFSPDSRLIATGADDRTARLWISTTGAELARLIHNGPVQNAVFSADGRSLLTVTKVWEFGGEDIARLWDVATGTLLWHLPSSNVRSTKFAADGRTIVTYGDDGIAHTWDAALVLAERDDAFVCTIATEYLRGAGKLTDAELLLLRPILGENLEREVTARWASAM